MNTLIIDNFDSFTWNLAQYIAEVNGEEPLVVLNNQYSWEDLLKMGPFDNIVISPGPGTVERDSDFGVSRAAILHAQVPVLGVCLGHQGIAHAYGGRVVHAPEPVHGRISLVWHDDPLFARTPMPLQVVRYHSLLIAEPLPRGLMAIARTASGLLMGLRHRTRALWGVQFHPESILTEHGLQIMRNFRDLSFEQQRPARVFMPEKAAATEQPADRVDVIAKEIVTPLTSEDIFVGLYGQSHRVFWLDSALVADGLARFSFFGEAGSEGVLSHWIAADPATRERQGNAFLHRLESRLARQVRGGDELPFAFRGGWVGYFGYEMKALFGGEAAHFNHYPDTVWMHADRFVAIDHLDGRKWLVAAAEPAQEENARAWLAETAERIARLTPAPSPQVDGSREELAVNLDQTRAQYLTSIAACKRAIRDGESYEVCLTNKMTVAGRPDGLSLYRLLRAANPAPFAAYFRLNDLEIISASPERFLSVDADGRVEAKPIKGTCRRDADPKRDAALAENLQQSEKNRAENLMIVDLLRNDLGRVATTGSVRVPRLMHVESYATVHQLVSTITAQLRPDCDLLDLIRAAFPGGSITGAPKIRTMQIIDELERSARGVYCGSIGYLGYNRVMDLNIAIRTLVCDGKEISFGVGGAVTHLSDPDDEFEEILLKARALLHALGKYWCAGERQDCYRLEPARQDDVPEKKTVDAVG